MIPWRTAQAWLAAVCLSAGPMLAQDAPPGPQPLPHPEIAKPSLPHPAHPVWLYAVISVACAVLLALVLRMLLRKLPRLAAPSLPPLTLAHRQLMELLHEHRNLEPAETAHRVSVILRHYQMGRYRVRAPFRTREELYERGGFAADEEKRARFGPVALMCDQLAFAPAPGTHAGAEALIHAAAEALKREVYHAEGQLPGAEVQAHSAFDSSDEKTFDQKT